VSIQETLLWLLGIPSPSGEETALADALVARFEAAKLGGALSRHGDCLIVPISVNSGGPKILLSGHLDVASPELSAPARREEARIYGPGAADMKSGLALMVDLAERPSAARVDLTLVFSTGGERPYAEQELGPLLRVHPVLLQHDLALVLKPTDNKLKLGSGGVTHATFRFRGKCGHSGYPTPRSNALHNALPLLSQLANFEPLPDVIDGLTWYEFLCGTMASGGRPGNFVPDEVDISVQHQYGPSCDPEQSQTKLLVLAHGLATVRFEELAPSARPVANEGLVAALANAGVDGVEANQTLNDVARFTELGLAAVTFGPGTEAQSRCVEEWTDLAPLESARAILDRWFTSIAPSAEPKRRRRTAKV
jgi:succinyl-diaminopimelate desuccinylase